MKNLHCLQTYVGFMNSAEMLTEQGRVVLVGGAAAVSRTNVILDSLYYLSDGGAGAMWTKMDQKLKIGRFYHSAFLVHDNITNCS